MYIKYRKLWIPLHTVFRGKMTPLVFATYLMYSRLKIKIYLYRLKLTAPHVRHNYVYVKSGFHAQHEIISSLGPSPGPSLRIHVE
jgi:hypothetical protein